jgi:hypothetical protein
MIGEWLAAVEATALARGLRDSVWVYPLVNTGHILGVALLVGSIIPLDLRLVCAWRGIPLAPLWRVLTRTAAAGLAMAVVFGSLLFITRATEYAGSGFFVAKMAIVFAATANALALRIALPEEVSETHSAAGKPSRRLRIAGAISLAAWITALTLGRLVGYF